MLSHVLTTTYRLCWYVGEKYLRDLKAKEEFSPQVLESLEALSGFLISEVRTMERGSEPAKRDAKDQVPSDRVKDPAALARELRWRIRLAGGATSDDEDFGRPAKKTIVNGHGVKRKRSPLESQGVPVLFKNFQPTEWDVVLDLPTKEDSLRVTAPYPSEEGWHQRWSDWGNEPLDTDANNQTASVFQKRAVIVKIRSVDGGLERQRIERVFEKWVWDGRPVNAEVADADVNMEETSSPGKMDVDTDHIDHLRQEEEEPEDVNVDGVVV